MPVNDCFRVFGMNGSRKFAEEVARHIGQPLAPHIESSWDDGEFYVRADCNVRNCDCFIIQSLYTADKENVSQKTMKLALFCGSLWHASASRITLVIPHLSWSRQDRKNEPRAPVYTQYLAQIFEVVHADRILGMDFHNKSAIDNGYRLRTDELQAKKLLADAICKQIKKSGISPEDFLVLSPDSGGAKRAERGRDAIQKRLGVDNIDVVSVDKKRSGRKVEARRLTGSVRGKKVVVIDDLISTASSMKETHQIVTGNGGEIWGAAVTHGLFVGNANQNLVNFPRIFITDTVDPSCRLTDDTIKRLYRVDTAQLFAQAIKRTYEGGGSISELLDDVA